MTPSAQTAGGRRVRRWTRELIIEKILEWEARYGEAPCSADWNPSLARWRAQEWRAERYREGVWPSTNAAKRPFDGSFDAAVRAAGLEPRRPGPRRGAGVARPALPQRELAALVTTDRGQLTRGELAELRNGGPTGPAVLAGALKRLAQARAAGDRRALAAALGDIASAAVRWRDRL
jgi:hypothetical protein